jgi:hypothetical protein
LNHEGHEGHKVKSEEVPLFAVSDPRALCVLRGYAVSSFDSENENASP